MLNYSIVAVNRNHTSLSTLLVPRGCHFYYCQVFRIFSQVKTTTCTTTIEMSFVSTIELTAWLQKGSKQCHRTQQSTTRLRTVCVKLHRSSSARTFFFFANVFRSVRSFTHQPQTPYTPGRRSRIFPSGRFEEHQTSQAREEEEAAVPRPGGGDDSLGSSGSSTDMSREKSGRWSFT